MATQYLDREDVLLAYSEAVEVLERGALLAIHSDDQLESALARPMNAVAYENADLVRQAATLFWGFAAGHAFRDGNKRTAVVVLRAFLNLNGYDLSLSDDERFQMALDVAAGCMTVDQVEGRLRPYVEQL